RLGQVRLAAAGGADEQDVRLGQLDVVARAAGGLGLDPLVVVVDGDGQRLLRLVLPDHVLIQEGPDLHRLGQLVELDIAGLGEFLFDDLVAQVDALVADVDARPGDELLDLLLRLAAEGALEKVAAVTDPCHQRSPMHSRPGHHRPGLSCHACNALMLPDGSRPPLGSFSDRWPLTRRYLVEVGSPTPLRVVSSFTCTGFVGRRPDILRRRALLSERPFMTGGSAGASGSCSYRTEPRSNPETRVRR